MNRLLIPIVAVLSGLVSASASAEAPDFAQLGTYIQDAMKKWEVPGLAISIVKDDEVILKRGFGVRKIGEETPVDGQTLFAIGSTSKAFTATALGILKDGGKLNWDDRVQKHMPWFELYDPYVTRELTVRDLLCHRSGLTRGDRLWYGSVHSRAEVLRRVRFLKPTWSFRERLGYQNIMYLAAGELVPHITDSSWDDFVKQHLFLPLGMKTSNTSVLEIAETANAATPHSKVDDKVEPIDWRNLDNVGPAGSINSNVQELANWIRMNLCEGVFEGNRIVGAEVIREIQTPHTIGVLDDYHPDSDFLVYGLGWFLHNYRDRKIVEHGGAIDGMRAQVVLVPEEELGVVVLMNRDRSYLPAALCYRAIDQILGTKDRDWAADYLAISDKNKAKADSEREQQEADRVKDSKPAHPLDAYVGTYRSETYGDMRVTLDNDGLVIESGPTLIADLEHWQFETFRHRYRNRWISDRMLTFSTNTQGKVSSLNLSDIDDFERVENEVQEQHATEP